ncbi:hypothetical protein C8Q74DRAFT_970117 [Fomes fomentarius]|nr:hypothetical protein C8Q74DRAFT_970117 [Fomes fomentarius]
MADDSQTARIVAGYNDLQLENYVTIAMMCLLAYEYIITFDHEMKHFWKRTITGSSILFIVNQCLSLVFTVMNMPYPVITTKKTMLTCSHLLT